MTSCISRAILVRSSCAARAMRWSRSQERGVLLIKTTSVQRATTSKITRQPEPDEQDVDDAEIARRLDGRSPAERTAREPPPGGAMRSGAHVGLHKSAALMLTSVSC